MLRDALESSGNLARDAESVFQRVLVAVVAASSARKSTSAMPLPVHHAAVAGVGRAVLQASSPWSIPLIFSNAAAASGKLGKRRERVSGLGGGVAAGPGQS